MSHILKELESPLIIQKKKDTKELESPTLKKKKERENREREREREHSAHSTIFNTFQTFTKMLDSSPRKLKQTLCNIE